VGYRDWDESQHELPRRPRPEDYGWPTSGEADDGAWADGAGAGRTNVPETGRWSTTRNRWVPQPRPPEGSDFAISRFDDTGDISRPLELRRPPAGHGRVLDHDDWYESTEATKGWHAAATTPYPTDREPRDTYRPNTGRPPTSGPRFSDEPMFTDRLPMRGRPAYRDGARPGSHHIDYPTEEYRPEWATIEPRRPSGGYRPGYQGHPRYPDRGGGAEPRSRRSGPPVRSGPPRRRLEAPRRVPDWDLEDDYEVGGYFATVLATIAWYLLPIFGYIGWAFLLRETPDPGCLTDAGLPCPGPRMEALQHLLDNLPRIGVAVGASVVVALLLRWIADSWRAMAVGFSAAIVGAGVTTVLVSVLNSG
jgi:hypothetical protein